MKEKTREIKITDREKRIIELVSIGYTDSEITQALNMNISTLRGTITYLYNKTGTVNRQHLACWALRRGIIQ